MELGGCAQPGSPRRSVGDRADVFGEASLQRGELFLARLSRGSLFGGRLGPPVPTGHRRSLRQTGVGADLAQLAVLFLHCGAQVVELVLHLAEDDHQVTVGHRCSLDRPLTHGVVFLHHYLRLLRVEVRTSPVTTSLAGVTVGLIARVGGAVEVASWARSTGLVRPASSTRRPRSSTRPDAGVGSGSTSWWAIVPLSLIHIS